MNFMFRTAQENPGNAAAGRGGRRGGVAGVRYPSSTRGQPFPILGKLHRSVEPDRCSVPRPAHKVNSAGIEGKPELSNVIQTAGGQ